jgi:hypothetical protein
MRIPLQTLLILILSAFLQTRLQAQTLTPTETAGTDAESAAITQEKEKIELEQLQLQDAELKLKLMQAQAQLTPTSPTPTPQPAAVNGNQVKQALEDFKLAETKKAEALAKDNKDKTDVLILDLVNAEVWYKGVRYGIYEFYNLAADQDWKISKTLDERDPSGHARNLYSYQNVSLLRYENRDRGVFSMKAPLNTGDMDFLTPEGLSFKSASGDVRDNNQNAYFKYDSQGEDKGQRILKYVSPESFLDFNIQAEFWFDRHDKLTRIRFGTLGEH